MTKEEYQAAIPACCEFKTVEDHEKYLMLCWGLCHHIETGKEMICGQCEFNEDKK